MRFRLQPAIAFALLLVAAVSLHAEDKRKRREPEHHRNHHAPAHHNGRARHTMHSGSSIERRNGHVSGFHDERRHMDVHRSLTGARRVETFRADHSRVVAYSGHHGFVEHPYTYGGHAYFGRTYYRYGRPAGWHVYRSYGYHGYALRVWVPGHYYHPAFYHWAYRPWGVHVVYAWPWYHRPWYGYYGYYYAPAAFYTTPSAWLVDYTLSQDLASSYQSYDGAPPPAPSALADGSISPDVRNEIDQEVQNEIAIETAESELTDPDADTTNPSGIARLYTDGKPHVFLVSAPLDVEDADTGNECSLTAGDVLRTTDAPDPEEKTAALTVVSSKRAANECGPRQVVNVNLDDLQEMQNNFREHIADGLDELQKKQGTDGLPAIPADAAGTVQPAYAKAAPPPDPNAGTDIDKQLTDADAAEHDVTAEEAGELGIAPAPAPTQAPAPIERRPPTH